jgi:phage-related protein
MIPEDWADCMVIVNRTYQRFCGAVNLFDKKQDEDENPTMADIPPETSSTTSAA